MGREITVSDIAVLRNDMASCPAGDSTHVLLRGCPWISKENLVRSLNGSRSLPGARPAEPMNDVVHESVRRESRNHAEGPHERGERLR